MHSKYLVVHADDFGLSPLISRGILHTIKHGVVSSTSVIVTTRYLRDTRSLIGKNPTIDWGLHVWIDEPLKKTSASIVDETRRQFSIFRDTFGRSPSHFDFHKRFRFDVKDYFSLRMFAKREGIVFRYDNKRKFETRFYGFKNNKPSLEDISEERFISYLDSVGNGVTELICHPGWTSNRLKDPYRLQRIQELRVLISGNVKAALKKRAITLFNFKQYNSYVETL